MNETSSNTPLVHPLFAIRTFYVDGSDRDELFWTAHMFGMARVAKLHAADVHHIQWWEINSAIAHEE